MDLILKGHNYKYAVEQIMMILFPGEKPQYDSAVPTDNCAVCTLSVSGVWSTAVTTLYRGGRTARGIARIHTPDSEDRLIVDRYLQRIIKQSYYKAAVALTNEVPAWGALTGIRPAKLASKALSEGKSISETRRMFLNEFYVSPERTELSLDAAKASLAAAKSLAPDEVSLYIGIPFCPTRCVYCSFVSADIKRNLKLIDPYLEALDRELVALSGYLKEAGARIRTVYMGGGTPTTLTAGQLGHILDLLEQHYDLSRLTELTVEAGRPDTITLEKMQTLKSHGVHRVSVNPQSMRPEVLQAMGRSHTPEDILNAYDIVRRSGIPIVNMDLIAGLPKDTLSGFRSTIDTVIGLDPENITVHTLALKKGARLLMEREGLPSGEETTAMLDYAWSSLRAAGQEPYYLYRQKYMTGALENIGWCKPGTEGLYNICIMDELHSILALGAGGSTKLTDPHTGRIVRLTNPKYPQQYIERIDTICAEKSQITDFQLKLITQYK